SLLTVSIVVHDQSINITVAAIAFCQEWELKGHSPDSYTGHVQSLSPCSLLAGTNLQSPGIYWEFSP
ncbi:hypothetical protein KUCAC02_021096, partial [Chaenocephalus aceratus]